MTAETSFTVQTFNGHDKAVLVRPATFVGLQERALGKTYASLRLYAPAGSQEALGWNPMRFNAEDWGRVKLHGDGRSYGHPNTTPERWAQWVKGLLDGVHKVAVINTHLVNNAWGLAIRGERRLRRKLWRLGWKVVQRLKRSLERQGYAVFIIGDLNRILRFWDKLRRVVGKGFDRILYPRTVELLEAWSGDPNGSDHAPLFARFRVKAPA